MSCLDSHCFSWPTENEHAFLFVPGGLDLLKREGDSI